MNWLEMLQQIFQVCIIPLLGVLTTYLVMFIKNKSAALQEQTDNELYKKYIALLDETITKCVIATNQTYVEALKDKNAFDPEAQKKAFEMTYQSVLAILEIDALSFKSALFFSSRIFLPNVELPDKRSILSSVKAERSLIVSSI